MEKPKLFVPVRAVARLRRHLSLRTGRAYAGWIRRDILFQRKRHPREPGTEEVRQFLSHLAVEGSGLGLHAERRPLRADFSLQGCAGGRAAPVEGIVRAKRPARLPVVFSRQEVEATMARLTGTYRLIAGLLDGSGLRLMEALRLRVKDLDSDYMEILEHSDVRTAQIYTHVLN